MRNLAESVVLSLEQLRNQQRENQVTNEKPQERSPPQVPPLSLNSPRLAQLAPDSLHDNQIFFKKNEKKKKKYQFDARPPGVSFSINPLRSKDLNKYIYMFLAIKLVG